MIPAFLQRGSHGRYVSLHTRDPDRNSGQGDQTTHEATYAGYARVLADGATLDFPICTGGINMITYFAIGTAAAGPGKILDVGRVTPCIHVSDMVVPRLLLDG